MDFSQKLQELRRLRHLTQEELAKQLFVSRTAISKWESGRGYPSIDSLTAIASFFEVTVDELLSTREVLSIAKEDGKENRLRFRALAFGLLDVLMLMLVFLPVFAVSIDGTVQNRALVALGGARIYLRVAYCAVTAASVIVGFLTLALQSCRSVLWLKYKDAISLFVSVAALLVFIISSQPYAAIFSFALLSVKAFILIRNKI